jgi:ribonuclease P protein component
LELKPVFKKEERISSRKDLDLLFQEGKSFPVYPLRVVYVQKDFLSETPVSILISVPKKRIKRAVKRNRIKRLIKESYRLNKKELIPFLPERGKYLLIAFIFISDNECTYAEMENAMKKSLDLLKKKLS